MTYKIAISRYALTQKIPPGSPFWQQFNASFDNVDTEPDFLLQAIYDGRSITTQHKNNWRTSDNYLCGQHIGLDFDAGDKTSSLPYLTQDKFFLRYGAFAYSTVSHTDECPRSRLIFLLDTPIMQAKNYTLAVQAVLWLYGSADRQCKDSVRFFYGSKGCKFEYVNSVLPLEVVKKLISQYQETGQQEKHHASRKDYTAPPDQAEVAEALRVIPPWQIPYDEWVQVLMGIHAAFGEGGYSLAASWADAKQGELEQKWKSFKPSGNTAGAVTVATVFGIAKRFGWHKTGVAI